MVKMKKVPCHSIKCSTITVPFCTVKLVPFTPRAHAWSCIENTHMLEITLVFSVLMMQSFVDLLLAIVIFVCHHSSMSVDDVAGMVLKQCLKQCLKQFKLWIGHKLLLVLVVICIRLRTEG